MNVFCNCVSVNVLSVNPVSSSSSCPPHETLNDPRNAGESKSVFSPHLVFSIFRLHHAIFSEIASLR